MAYSNFFFSLANPVFFKAWHLWGKVKQRGLDRRLAWVSALVSL